MKTAAFLILALVGLTTTAWALTLEGAKAQGLVGEQADGYLAAVNGSPSGEVARLVEAVNERRRDKYREIARRNGTSLDVVEKLAGKKAIEKTAPGLYVQLPSGQWVRK